MSTQRETLFVRDATGALVDSGSTPTWTHFARCDADGTVVSTTGPTITDVGVGQYEFVVTLTAGQYARGEIAVTSPGVGPYTYAKTYAEIAASDAPSASDVATAVWDSDTRTLTGFGTLASDVASAVWTAGSRTLTSTLLSAADVWSYATRTITSGGITAAEVWDHLTSAVTTSGSVGKLIKDNVDATVSSRLASSSYTAPDNTSIAAAAADAAIARKAQTNKVVQNAVTGVVTLYDDNGTTPLEVFDVLDGDGNATTSTPLQRVPR